MLFYCFSSTSFLSSIFPLSSTSQFFHNNGNNLEQLSMDSLRDKIGKQSDKFFCEESCFHGNILSIAADIDVVPYKV